MEPSGCGIYPLHRSPFFFQVCTFTPVRLMFLPLSHEKQTVSQEVGLKQGHRWDRWSNKHPSWDPPPPPHTHSTDSSRLGIYPALLEPHSSSNLYLQLQLGQILPREAKACLSPKRLALTRDTGGCSNQRNRRPTLTRDKTAWLPGSLL